MTVIVSALILEIEELIKTACPTSVLIHSPWYLQWTVGLVVLVYETNIHGYTKTDGNKATRRNVRIVSVESQLTT